MRGVLAVVLVLTGCATAFERVSAVKTLPEAREALGRTQLVAVNQHSPTAESWYFDWQHCILFVGGRRRWTKSIEETGVKNAERKTVDCSLEAFEKEHGPIEQSR